MSTVACVVFLRVIVTTIYCYILLANSGQGHTTTVLMEDARKKDGPNMSPVKNFDSERDGRLDEKGTYKTKITSLEVLHVKMNVGFGSLVVNAKERMEADFVRRPSTRHCRLYVGLLGTWLITGI